MALSLWGALEAHYVRLLKQLHEEGGPHLHLPPVLAIDSQGRAMTLMQMWQCMWQRQTRAWETDDATEATLLN